MIAIELDRERNGVFLVEGAKRGPKRIIRLSQRASRKEYQKIAQKFEEVKRTGKFRTMAELAAELRTETVGVAAE